MDVPSSVAVVVTFERSVVVAVRVTSLSKTAPFANVAPFACSTTCGGSWSTNRLSDASVTLPGPSTACTLILCIPSMEIGVNAVHALPSSCAVYVTVDRSSATLMSTCAGCLNSASCEASRVFCVSASMNVIVGGV